MKIKSIVASLLVLGLVSGGAFAASTGSMSQQMSQLQAKINQMQNQMDTMSAHSMSAKSDGSGASFVKVNSAVTKTVVAPAGTPGTVNALLNARHSNMLANNSVYVGGSLGVVAAWDHASTAAGDSTYHPTLNASNSEQQSSSYIWANDLDLDTVATGSWVTGVVTLSAQAYNNNDVGNNSILRGFGVHDAYAVMGNLSKTPMYGFVGRMPVMFGNLGSLGTYSVPFTTMLFQGTADQLGMGYSANNLTMNVAVFNANQSGASSTTALLTTNTVGLDYLDGWYVAADDANGKQQIANFTVNANYKMSAAGMDWVFGAGYLNGSPYQSTSGRNAAWDLNASVAWANWHALAEYIQTGSAIVGSDSKLKTWNIQLANDFNMMGKASQASVGFSQLTYGSAAGGTSNQVTVGMNSEWFNHVWLGAEYRYQSSAFAPNDYPVDIGRLNASGSNSKDNSFFLTAKTYF